jgi:HSP20 family protein
MAIARWEPGRDALSLRDAVNNLFSQSFWSPFGSAVDGFGGQVAMDVYTEGDGYVVEAELPGLNPDDVKVEMVGETLTISGEYPSEVPAERHYLLRGRQGGRFQTSVTLPDAADPSRIVATYQQGLLHLVIPKSEAARPKRIALKASS